VCVFFLKECEWSGSSTAVSMRRSVYLFSGRTLGGDTRTRGPSEPVLVGWFGVRAAEQSVAEVTECAHHAVEEATVCTAQQ
jgi:hypothetical protein